MNLKKLIEQCESLEQTLEMAHEEALDIQKSTGAENLDVMHIAQAREILAMRIGYLQRQVEKAEEEKAANAVVENKTKTETPTTETGGAPQ